VFFSFYVFYCSYYFTFARENLQYLLENNQQLYSLHCSVLTPHVLISIRYIFKTSHCHSVLDLQPSLSRTKLCRKTQALTMSTANAGLTLSARWKILHLLLKIPKTLSTQLRELHNGYLYTFLLTLRLDPTKVEVYFCLAQIPHLLPRSMVHQDILFLQEVSH
jgi:hypothetical protein